MTGHKKYMGKIYGTKKTILKLQNFQNQKFENFKKITFQFQFIFEHPNRTWRSFESKNRNASGLSF